MSSLKPRLAHWLPAVTIAGMESCWLLAALLLVMRKTGLESLPLSGLLAFYPLAFLFHRLLGRRPRTGRRRSSLLWVLWAFLCILLLAGLPRGIPVQEASQWARSLLQALFPWPIRATHELLVLVSSAVLWFMGTRLSRMKVEFNAVASSFQFGLSIFVGLAFLAGHGGCVPDCFVYGAPAFFFFALLGLSITHTGEGLWTSGSQRIPWGLLLLFVIMTIIVLGLLFGSLVKPDLLKQVYALLKWCWDGTVGLLWKWILYLLSLLPKTESAPMLLPYQPPPVAAEPVRTVHLFRIPEAVRSAAKTVYITMWLMIILWALWSISSSIISWFGRKIRGDEDAEGAKLSGAFREDLLLLLRKIVLFVIRVKTRMENLLRRRREKRALPPEVATVRQVYGQLLKWAASKGCPRDSAQTPREYLVTLSEWLPRARWELAFITHQYVHVRYGPTVPSEKVLRKVLKSLRLIKECSPSLSKEDGKSSRKEESQNGKSDAGIDS